MGYYGDPQAPTGPFGNTHVTSHMGVSSWGQQVATCLLCLLTFLFKIFIARLNLTGPRLPLRLVSGPYIFLSPPTHSSLPTSHVRTYIPLYPVEEVRWRGSSALSIVLRPTEQSTYRRLLLCTL